MSANVPEWDVTDGDLAKMADWAERMEIAVQHPDWKKAYGAIRQGSDWILRRRARSRDDELKEAPQELATARKQ